MGRHAITGLVGARFGTLTVTGRCRSRVGERYSHWFCRCDCGAEKVVRGANLTTGNTVSCGDMTKHPPIDPIELSGDGGASFEEIGRAFGISRQRARAEFESALRKIRRNARLMAELEEHK